ncbi:MATE family efflux transporter [Sphingomonas sp. 28-63-12]|uniref:MATE family efflux transporter n=1 Tax=Sphingomonas sp. 28-63-12 TaxID=1970434 RepID=UPI000BDC125F|nr:MAG: MATE family efflux transporter [Sphingomonas sp. 28-63-12]
MAQPPSRPGSRDLTTGPIGKTLLVFALPTMASNVLQSLNGSINAVWVGRYLGESALAATSNANNIMFLMFAAVFGFGMAATILVGQSFGRRDIDGARRAFGSAVGLIFWSAIVVAALGWIFAPGILHLLATPGAAMPLALTYLRIIFLGLPSSMLMVLMMMGLRGTGDSMTPLWFGMLASALDVILNPVLIAGIGPFPQMGIAGSATATLIANVVSVAGLVSYIYAKDLTLRLRGPELGYLFPSRDVVWAIVTKGVPIGAQMIVIALAGLTMMGLVNREGVDTTAAFGVSLQLWAYIQMPAMAVGAAVSAMAAQNIGAGKWDRVEAITRSGLVFTTIITTTMVAVLLVFDRPVMALFLGWDSPALPIARHIQLLSTWNFILFGMTMVFFGVVRANGAVVGPLIILFIAMFPVRIGFATALKPLLGVDALWLSFPLGSVATFVLSALFYRYGAWRNERLVVPPAHHAAEAHAQAVGEPAATLHPAG